MLPGIGWCGAGLPLFRTACWWLTHPAAITGVCFCQMGQSWKMWWTVCSAPLQSQSAESMMPIRFRCARRPQCPVRNLNIVVWWVESFQWLRSWHSSACPGTFNGQTLPACWWFWMWESVFWTANHIPVFQLNCPLGAIYHAQQKNWEAISSLITNRSECVHAHSHTHLHCLLVTNYHQRQKNWSNIYTDHEPFWVCACTQTRTHTHNRPLSILHKEHTHSHLLQTKKTCNVSFVTIYFPC